MSHLVNWPTPLVREPSFYAGQLGVRGSDAPLGLRQSVEGNIYFVDPNYPGATTTADGTLPTNPLSTVAAAMTRVQPYHGDVIAVMASNAWGNTYGYGRLADGMLLPIAENAIIDVPGVRIVGVAPANSNGVVWVPATDGGTCITVTACDVLIEGFFFDEGPQTGCNAIDAIWNGATAWGDNLTVRNCVFSDTVDTAIDLDFSYYVNIYNCVFWDCDARGIYCDPAGSPSAFCNIHDNIFHDCATGAILMAEGTDNHIYRNSIYNSSAVAAAAATDLGIALGSGGDNQVFDNWLSCALPVPANGDYSDMNSAGAGDAWINNHCMNGDATTNP